MLGIHAVELFRVVDVDVDAHPGVEGDPYNAPAGLREALDKGVAATVGSLVLGAPLERVVK